MPHRITEKGLEFLKQNTTLTGDELIFTYLKLASSPEMAIDGTTPKSFDYVSPPGKVSYLSVLNIMIQDAGISPEKFGGVLALANGVDILLLDSAAGITRDLGNYEKIKTNYDFGFLSGGEGFTIFPGSGTSDMLTGKVNFRLAGFPVVLQPGEILRMIINDNLATLEKMRALLCGFLCDI